MSTAAAEKTDESTQSESIPSFDVTVRIRRYTPEFSSEVTWEEFNVTMYGTDRVLDCLHTVSYTHLTLPTTPYV